MGKCFGSLIPFGIIPRKRKFGKSKYKTCIQVVLALPNVNFLINPLRANARDGFVAVHNQNQFKGESTNKKLALPQATYRDNRCKHLSPESPEESPEKRCFLF